MSELIVIQPESMDRYKTISLTAAEDPRLSWESKGLHTYLISRPPGWRVYFNDLLNRSNCGRDKLRRMLDELESCGYVKSEQKQDPKTRQFLPKTYNVYFEPLTENPLTGNPLTEKPSTGEPFTENPPLNNKKDTNYQNKNKQLNNKQSIDHFASRHVLDPDPIDSFDSQQQIQTKESNQTTPSQSKVFEAEKTDRPPAACGKVEKPKAPKVGEHDPAGFAQFWEQYPKKTARVDAIRAWNKLKPNPELVGVILHDVAQRKAVDSQWSEVRFVPNPATYINAQRWTDDIIKPSAPPPVPRHAQQTNNGSDRLKAIARLRGEA